MNAGHGVGEWGRGGDRECDSGSESGKGQSVSHDDGGRREGRVQGEVQVSRRIQATEKR